jgi:hypothetical protein
MNICGVNSRLIGAPHEAFSICDGDAGIQLITMNKTQREFIVEAIKGMSVLDRSELSNWEQCNARRGELIRQKYTDGLTPVEQNELDLLEDQAKQYLDAVAPVQNYPLDALKVYVDRIKASRKNVP